MLAIVDARPEGEPWKPLVTGRQMEDAMVQVTQGLREIFGRSPDAYGVTPLYIFRPIRIPAKEQAQ